MNDTPDIRLERAGFELSRFRYQQALALAQEVLGELEAGVRDRDIVACAHELAGQAALGMGDIGLASEHLSHAVELLSELGESARMMVCQLGQAECSMRRSDLAQARHICKHVRTQAEHDGLDRLAAHAELSLGSIKWMQGDAEAALPHLAGAESRLRELGEQALLYRAYCSEAVARVMIGDEQTAQELLSNALNYFRGVNDVTLVARCLNNLAGIAYGRRDWSRAREYLLQCVNIETELQDRGDLALTWYNLALVEMREANTKLARKYFNRAFQLAQDCGDRDSEAAALIQLGVVCLLESDTEEALNYALLSETRAEGSSSAMAATVQSYIPLILLANNQLEAAAQRWSTRTYFEPASTLESLGELLHFITSEHFTPKSSLTPDALALALDWEADLAPPAPK
jgi:tetratricopeptide (TPR) repeat protein